MCVESQVLPHSQAFPPSSFWSLAVCKNGGGRSGIFYYVNGVSVYLGRQRRGGVPHCISCTCSLFLTWSGTFFGLRTFGACGRTTRSSSLFQWGTLPPSVYLGRYWRHSCDKIYQAFPLHFCLLQAIENWTRPGNKVMKFVQQGLFYRLVWRWGVQSEPKHQTHLCVTPLQWTPLGAQGVPRVIECLVQFRDPSQVIETFTVPENTPWEKKYHDWLINWVFLILRKVQTA